MDISLNYIVMCATKELQEDIPLEDTQLGDFVAVSDTETEGASGNTYTVGRLSEYSVGTVKATDGSEKSFKDIERCGLFFSTLEPIKMPIELDFWFIKLFEQDEIQERLVELKDMDIFKLLVEFNHFYLSLIVNEGYSDFFDTLEKCWLAFYMYEIHDKEWMGKEWVKVKKLKKNFLRKVSTKPVRLPLTEGLFEDS